MYHIVLTIVRIVAFILTLALWRWLLGQTFGLYVNLFCIVGTLLVIFPTVWIGRKLLDLKPTIERVGWVNTIMHAVLMVLFGIAIVKAIQTGDTWQGVVIPIPHSFGLILTCGTGAITLLTVLNLALRGLGAPFDIVLSRRLATDWMYTWTRNPMVLATLACLLAIGLLLQSALFVVWVLVLVAPTWIVYLTVYEEHELEIRFGQSYRQYKAKTSFLWPRRPKP
jgi:protein-S-isoprenylcysteine O-methyltransferase Ste14